MPSQPIHSSYAPECAGARVGDHIETYEQPLPQQLASIEAALALMVVPDSEDLDQQQHNRFVHALTKSLPYPQFHHHSPSRQTSATFAHNPISIDCSPFDLGRSNSLHHPTATQPLTHATSQVISPAFHALSQPDIVVRFVNLPQRSVCLHRLYGVGVVKMIQLDELGQACSLLEANARFRQGVALALLHLATAFQIDGAWLGISLVGSNFSRIVMLDDRHAVVETSPTSAHAYPAFQSVAAYFQSHDYTSLGRNLLAVDQISSDNPCNIDPDSYLFFADFYTVLFAVIRHSIVEQALSPLDKSTTMQNLFGDILNDIREMPRAIAVDTRRERKDVTTSSLAKRKGFTHITELSGDGRCDDEIHRAESHGSSPHGSGFWTKEAIGRLDKHLRDKVSPSVAKWQQGVAEAGHPTLSVDPAEFFYTEASARQDLWPGPPEYCHGRDPYDMITALDIRILPVDTDTFERFVARRMEQAGVLYSDSLE
ncbi:hypothetical protein L198_03869 [Cryptococcus wingfieldii CBS 7118]|uniref:Uncharacterized protein n=1 Tax=Cryptococcus wingfieldii CBS 7118 TaxID=1295528 RepID=A0A1E3JB15_9TREE|nr:hypothetical protein L198_03869 [Cryptococcus wingfieldii CBS 7118]ODN97306.1 hypothetical protein L198_03869 [Cryptococcus wingfieldii CBS 7118]